MQAGAVPNAAGSAYIEQGNTKVLATVYGPRQAGERASWSAEGFLLLDLVFSAVSSRYVSKEDNDKRVVLYSSILQRTLESIVLLERYSKLVFDISILVLEDDGCVLAAALAAASLALANAKVEMRDLAAGATVHLVGGSNGRLLLDCEGCEEDHLPDGSAVLHLGLCPARNKVCLLHSSGPLPAAHFESMMAAAKETARAVGDEIRRSLEDKIEKRCAKRARKQARVSKG